MMCDYCKGKIGKQETYTEPCFGIYKKLHLECSDILSKKKWYQILTKLDLLKDKIICYPQYLYFMIFKYNKGRKE